MWRKNLRPSEPQACPGVDCNRNFPRYVGGEGSSATECAGVYHGPSALSEPESANIAHLANVERSLLFGIDSHSYGRAVFRPHPNGGTYIPSLPVSPADEAIYAHLESAMVDSIARVDGVRYSTGTSNHTGTTDEYLICDQHIFAFDLECGEDFRPPIEAAITAAQEVAAAVRTLGLCAAGETGLDIEALLQHRTTIADRAQTPSVTAPVPEKPWNVEALAEDQWPRLLVSTELAAAIPAPEQAPALIDKGFDLELSEDQRFAQIIASTDDLERLRRLGYAPVVVRDLLKD